MRVLNVVTLALLLGVALCQDTRPDWQPTYLGESTLRHSAFVELIESADETLAYEDRWKMFVSTFDALLLGTHDDVFYMRSPGRYLDSVSSWHHDYIVKYDTSAYWPNDIIYMPSSVVGTEGIVQTSGFLVPTKKDGQLQLYDTTVEPPSLLTNIAQNDSNEWSYHRIKWQDMDLDGDLDCVTARFHVPNLGSTKTEFMWFENPDSSQALPAWTEHVISSDGPDVDFDRTVLSAGGVDYEVYVMGEFFGERISIFWTENPDNDWSDADSINSRIINAAAGQVFDVLIDDLNRDGALEFISTEYDSEAQNGTVKVYFFPEDFRTDDFTSIVISDGFVPGNPGGNTMSPGSPNTFYPSAAYEEDLADDGMQHKPWILLSGDDDGKTYILYPTTEDRTDWSYDKNILVDTEDDTCGKMSHADLDGDGYEEIVVPGYSSGKLYVFTYAPQE